MFIIGLTGIARTTCIETTGKMPVANHAPNLCPHHQRQDRTGYDGIEQKTQQRLQGHAVIRHDSGIPYPVIYFRRQGIYRRRWKYARPCESPVGRALHISIPGVVLVATVGIGGILRHGRYPADATQIHDRNTYANRRQITCDGSFPTPPF